MSPVCPLCGSAELRTVSDPIVRCLGCGLEFTITDGFDARQAYGESYFKGTIYRDYVQEKAVRTRLFKEKLKLLDKYLPSHGRLLDVGCAAGFFLKLASDLGYDCFGVDVSEYATRYARETMNLRVFNGTVADAHFPDAFFDLITMWDVLEHISDFLAVLRECHRILRKDGILVVETLNTDSLLARLLGHKWPLYAPKYHLSYFNKRTLRLALELAGFKIGEMMPMQTYIRTLTGFKPVRYFASPLLRGTVGKLLDDVVLVIGSRTD
ncbi:MAG: class I SAM-dependent methyltransferase [Candidatus Bathyarchaeia archaeon]